MSLPVKWIGMEIPHQMLSSRWVISILMGSKKGGNSRWPGKNDVSEKEGRCSDPQSQIQSQPQWE